MANMFWNLDKISETTAIHSGFRLCPIISHSSMRRTIPVAFIYKTPPVVLNGNAPYYPQVSFAYAERTGGFIWKMFE